MKENVNLEANLHRQLLDRIIIPESDFPTVISIIGPCRTGTGALKTAITGALPALEAIGTQPVHTQPQKAIARQILERQGIASSTKLEFFADTMVINPGNHTELTKETFGPDPTSPADFLNPIANLIEKGFPASRLIVIPTIRHLLPTAASWQSMWQWPEGQFPVDGFNRSFTWTLEIVQTAQQQGATIVPLDFDLFKNHRPELIFKNLFSLIGLPFSPQVLEWKKDRYFAGIKYDQPPINFIKGALSRQSGGRGKFEWKPIKVPFTRRQRQQLLRQFGPARQVHRQLATLSRRLLLP